MSDNQLNIADRRLLGTEEVTVDDRGRIQLSVRKAEALGADAACVVRPENCLVIYPKWRWDQIISELLVGPAFNPEMAELHRHIFGASEEGLSADKQGRLVLPSRGRLATAMHPGTKVLVIGMAASMEIWRIEDFNEYQRYQKAYREKERNEFRGIYDEAMRSVQRRDLGEYA